MTETEARAFRAAYQGAVTRYSRMSKTALAAEERALMADQGIQRVYGGPASKDEFLSSVLDLRGYTIARLNEATHVLHHTETWPDCEYCQDEIKGTGNTRDDVAPVDGTFMRQFVPSGTGWPVT